MEESIKNLAGELVIALLDIIVILQVEDNPVIGVILVVLFDIVTVDPLIRITLILLVIVLGLLKNNSF